MAASWRNQQDGAYSEELPFMNEHEIQAMISCLQVFTQPVNALEWGSGKSTLFFSKFLPEGSHWDAIEHNLSWSEEIKNRIREKNRDDLSLHFVPNNTYFNDGVDDGNFDSFYDYVLFPLDLEKKFDFILVDGRARVECLRLGWKLVKNDGFMVLHDAQRKEYHHALPDNGYFVKISNPYVQNEGDIAIYFMSRDPDRIRSFAKSLEGVLPDYLRVEKNFSESESRTAGTQARESVHAFPQDDSKTIIPDVDREKSCLFVNTYYPGFLQNHYSTNRFLNDKSYQEQLSSIQQEFFGDCDFYSSALGKYKWGTQNLIANCEPLQTAWARENDFSGNGLAVLIEQIRRLSPDVVYLQDLNIANHVILAAIRPYVKLIVGQIASPMPQGVDLDSIDILISSFPHFVERFRNAGKIAYYQPLAFDPRVLDVFEGQDREYPLTFVGGISPAHGAGLTLLEYLASSTPIEFWGYGAESLPRGSSIPARHHGEVWGRDMFRILGKSAITVNRHIDVSENYANNMRLFEATGCGALLITDYKDNLSDLFEIGKEVVAYRSMDECAALIHYYLRHPDEAREIADAGQKKTLAVHTYDKRLEYTAEILERHISNQSNRYSLTADDLQNVSTNKRNINKEEAELADWDAWKSDIIPSKQRALVNSELKEMYQGNTPLVFNVLSEALKPLVCESTKILEIGCASGYYYEVLDYLLNRQIDYTGVDYSENLIQLAREYYPAQHFLVADGANLPFADQEYPIVISSCILLHVGNYRDHIRETARVAGKYVVAHRTPVCRKGETSYIKKLAYGVETVEVTYNEYELLNEFVGNGLRIIAAYEYAANEADDRYEVTYVFSR